MNVDYHANSLFVCFIRLFLQLVDSNHKADHSEKLCPAFFTTKL